VNAEFQGMMWALAFAKNICSLKEIQGEFIVDDLEALKRPSSSSNTSSSSEFVAALACSVETSLNHFMGSTLSTIRSSFNPLSLN